jgi:hypothetical protein
LLFFGAGASAPFGIPTTPTLTKETVELLNAKSQSLLEKINLSHLDQWVNEPNYEEILGYLTAYANPAELRNDDYRLSFARKNPQFRNEQGMKDLIDAIHQIVCNYCNQPFIKGTDKYLKPEELESKFQATYDALVGTYFLWEKSPVVFSTNYDPSLEIWCLKRNIQCIDGTERTSNIEVNRILNETRHKEAIQNLTKNSNALGLIRLHGSIWTHEINEKLRIKFTTPPDMRMFSDLYQHTSKNKPNLIFPGQEDNVSRGQSDVLYQYFKDSLEGNCLFVGFSFRHEIFNRPILDKLQSGKIRYLGILSPHANESVKRLLNGEKRFSDRIISMQAEFGERNAVDELAQKWFSKAEGFVLNSGYSLLERLRDWREKRENSYIK